MSNENLPAKSSNKVNTLLQNPEIRKRFSDVIGKRAPAFISGIISAVNANSYLTKADPLSVISSAMIAASLDLPITPGLGLAHIVPYEGKAQFQVGWKGYIQLALRSGQYATIHLTRIFDGQLVKRDQFTGRLEFQDKANSDKVIGYLLYFELLTGFKKQYYMSSEECYAHGKRYSMSFKRGKGKWVDAFDDMALKTVAKMGLSKFGILSVEMQRAIETDQAVVDQDGNVIEYPDGARNVVDAEAEADRMSGVIDKALDSGEDDPPALTEGPRA